MSTNRASLLHPKKKKKNYFTPSDGKLQHLTTTKNASSERDVFLKNRQEPSLEK